jgi:hypothetical protein
MTDQRFKAEKGIHAAGPNTTFESNVYVNGSTLFIGQDMIIGGNLVYSNTSIVGDLIPTIAEANLGNNTNRFYLWTTTINTNTAIIPTANGKPLGSDTARWLTYSSNVSASGILTVSGNVAVNTTAFVVDAANKRASVNGAAGSAALTVTGTSALVGNVTITGNSSVSGIQTVGSIALANGGITSNTTAVTTGAATIVDAWPLATGHAAKITMFVDGSALPTPVIHSLDMLVIHDGTTVLMTKYGEIFNTSLGTFDANITGSNVNVTFTASTANTYYVKSIRQLMS